MEIKTFEKTIPYKSSESNAELAMDAINYIFSGVYGTIVSINTSSHDSGGNLYVALKTVSGSTYTFLINYLLFNNYFIRSGSTITIRCPYYKNSDMTAIVGGRNTIMWVVNSKNTNGDVLFGFWVSLLDTYHTYYITNSEYTQISDSKFSIIALPASINYYKNNADCIVCAPLIPSADFSKAKMKKEIPNLYVFSTSKSVTTYVGDCYEVSGKHGLVLCKSSGGNYNLIYFYE